MGEEEGDIVESREVLSHSHIAQSVHLEKPVEGFFMTSLGMWG